MATELITHLFESLRVDVDQVELDGLLALLTALKPGKVVAFLRAENYPANRVQVDRAYMTAGTRVGTAAVIVHGEP